MDFEVATQGVLRVYLQVHQGLAAGQRFSITQYPSVIGRGSGCDVQLADDAESPTLSRQHCRLALEGGRIIIEDLSRNGTWVGDRQLERGETVALKGGEPVWLGTETLITVDFSTNTERVANAHPSRRDGATTDTVATQRQVIRPVELLPSKVAPASPTSETRRRLILHTLGRLTVSIDDVVLADSLWPSRKALVLLVLLAENDPDSVSSERMTDVLWPDGRGGKSALQTAVSRVRQAFRGLDETLPDPIRNDRHRYSIAADYQTQCDSRIFEAGCVAARNLWGQGQELAAETELSSVLPLYGGAFMEDAGEDFIVQRRVRLTELYIDSGVSLGLLRERRQDFRGALELYSMLLERYPAREAAQCGLIRCLASQGHRDEALRQYEHCTRQLKRMLDVTPGPQMLELREAVSRGLALPAPPAPFS